ncbi:hypothetical protein QYF36_000757 [Acer negundo]|nr:hypothetical protein QYF36_000757 [Acer negundo]
MDLITMQLAEFNRQMEFFASRTLGLGQAEAIACTFCGIDFDNPGSSYEKYADSYMLDWRRDQDFALSDTQANAYEQLPEETLNNFIQNAQAFQ